MFICVQSPICSAGLLEAHGYGLSLETMKWERGTVDLNVLQPRDSYSQSTQASYDEEAWCMVTACCLSRAEMGGRTRILLGTYLVLSLPVQGLF